ncbi:DNA-binding ferritin-like protein [Mycobacterium europaeum]|uniref:DNA-binding ferritin-like protein n=1 Tax=Mycobacterium europaeum TaxID=761804 RepID=A0A0U1DKB5_9MYCO|nr:DNA starvation/stationary phase protection protein [Mycobacterium europaeum]CQD18181.1 DNA-binding ferritin-like protein [Mycobacterium europaeum]
MLTSQRRSRDEVREFDAPPSLTENLQRVLVDLIELHLQGKQAHWNVVGTNFRDLHLQLDEIVDIARDASDTIAERIRALNAVPDGRSDTVTASTTLPAFPAAEQTTTDTVDFITTAIYTAAHTLRTVHDDVDDADPSSADLLHTIIDALEKAAWMLKSENRKI